MSHTISVTATDQGGLSVDDSFNITVIEYNELAETEDPQSLIPDQQATEDMAFEYTIPSTTFANAQNQSWLSYSAERVNDDNGSTCSPIYLASAFDPPGTESFLGHPKTSMLGAWTIRVTASDCSGSEIVDEFVIDVANVNDPPTVGGGGGGGGGNNTSGPPVLADQYAEALEQYSYYVEQCILRS